MFGRGVRSSHWVLAAMLASVVTLVNQGWVGKVTLYDPSNDAKRERLHDAILTGQLPPDAASWDELGAESTNIRPVSIWLAELVHQTTGQPVVRSYVLLETLSVFLCCLLLFKFISDLVGPAGGLLTILYVGCVLPLSFFLHYFHPWDKPALVFWTLALIATYWQRWVLLAVVLAVAVCTKFDTVVFPLLVLLTEVRRGTLSRALLISGVLGACTVSVYALLLTTLGPVPNSWTVSELVSHNVEQISVYGLLYPPLIGLALPFALAVVGYRSADGFSKACVEFAAVVAGLLFVQTFFEEFRVLLPLIPLTLPAAIYGLARVLDAAPAPVPARQRRRTDAPDVTLGSVTSPAPSDAV